MLVRAGTSILKTSPLLTQHRAENTITREMPRNSTPSRMLKEFERADRLTCPTIKGRKLESLPRRQQTCDTTASLHSTRTIQESFCSSSVVPPCDIRRKCPSTASSGRLFPESSQTLMCFDWDDTLFPTSDVYAHMGSSHDLPEALRAGLQNYQDTLKQFLSIACSLSNRCAIVTNSKRPWVDRCIDRFLPGLKNFMQMRQESGEIVIIYAQECLPKEKGKLRPVRRSIDAPAQQSALTTAKYHAMKKEATSFYSRYPGQTWKNILSFGDMEYERRAVQEVTWRRKGPQRERIRTKAISLPVALPMDELALTWQLLQILLPAFVHFDGDIDTSLKEAKDQWEELSMALRIPELAQIPNPLRLPCSVEVTESLDQVAILVHEKFRAEPHCLDVDAGQSEH